ncbi:hypothetical protein HELRODRAFT_182094 [Helobdella robusta]|uniref:Uncharacterized protein n=1 Tax=Helobdella robusta TaxID=6412 RepID=T1FHQ6_HELRO|nr:hypothetical protein HELRODRAFT_182094 [Helobdella robusta]ESN91239.1 hypothetical protein HELRODRAFT_182094 [Helobdella robusta]
MALSIRQKRLRRIPRDPVHGVAVQGSVDGLAPHSMVWRCKAELLRRMVRPGDPVHGVAVQGPVDGLATGTPLYSVVVQGTMDGRITFRPRDYKATYYNYKYYFANINLKLSVFKNLNYS